MALEGAEWGAAAGVFVIVFAMMLYNRLAAQRRGGSGGAKKEATPDAREHLSRFVVHDGDVVGEVVSRDGDHLIVKHQGTFRAVPVAVTRIANDEVHVHGDVDWDAAKAQGTAWHAANTKGQHDEISPSLTTSDDVKRPAFEAFQSRQKEVRGEPVDDVAADGEEE